MDKSIRIIGLGESFPLGQTVATPHALRHLTHDDILSALKRHAAGDWGDLDDYDRQANDRALRHGGRLFSAHHAADGVKIWIITEADRSSSCVLLPVDY